MSPHLMSKDEYPTIKKLTSSLILAVLVTASALLALPASSFASQACTDSFVGANNAKWTEAANWSADRVPTREDVACIPAGITASLWFESGAPSSIQVHSVHGGSIFTNVRVFINASASEDVSSLESLGINGTDVVVDSGGELALSHELFINGYSSLTGAGTITLEPSAVGEFGEVGCGQLFMNNARIVNKGTLHVGRDHVGGMQVGLLNNAAIVNEGALGLDSQIDVSADCARQTEGATIYRYSPGSAYVGEALINKGTLQTEWGSSTETISTPLTNDGLIAAREGGLDLAGGSVPTECSTGSWASSGATLALTAGTFNIAPGDSLGSAVVEPGASIAGCPTPASGGTTAGGSSSGGTGGSTHNEDSQNSSEGLHSAPTSVPALNLGVGRCVVPKIKRGTTLARARTILAEHHCRLGHVYKARARHLRAGLVIGVHAHVGARLSHGAAVSVVVAEREISHRRR